MQFPKSLLPLLMLSTVNAVKFNIKVKGMLSFNVPVDETWTIKQVLDSVGRALRVGILNDNVKLTLSDGKVLKNDDTLGEKDIKEGVLSIAPNRRRLGNQRLIDRFIRESERCINS